MDLCSTSPLEEPRRFKRPEYLEACKSDQKVDKEQFWRTIPGNMFVIMASDIVSLNLRYTPNTLAPWLKSKEFVAALRKINEILMSATDASSSPDDTAAQDQGGKTPTALPTNFDGPLSH